MRQRGILIAVDSVGIDPRGHDHLQSIYNESRFLFPQNSSGDPLPLIDAAIEGALVETDVTAGNERGSIECALTYTSHFTGFSAVQRHGLMQGLGLNSRVLEELVAQRNLFRLFPKACLANALFPANFSFLGKSYSEDLVPTFDREQVEAGLTVDGKPVNLLGTERNGFEELFTLAEINKNIFVHAAREADVPMLSYADVRAGRALTSSMTHELENRLNFEFFDQSPLPLRTPAEAAAILVELAEESPFVFYKYQIPDLVSHSGRPELAREVFATIEEFVQSVLVQIDPEQTIVVVTSDHGHLEQVDYHEGHPKTRVPTWYFGPQALQYADRLRTPEAIYHRFAELASPAS